MDATCAICGKTWDTLDPGVRYVHGDGRWECWDEQACMDRRVQLATTGHSGQCELLDWQPGRDTEPCPACELVAMQRGLDEAWAAVDRAFAAMPPRRPGWPA